MTAVDDVANPGPPSQHRPRRRTRLHQIAPLLITLACLLASAGAVRDLGLTTDEPRYIDNSQRIHAWFGDLFSHGPSAAFEEKRLADGWYSARQDSKSQRLSPTSATRR